MKQQSSEWFKARRNRITGSIAGAALGLSPWMKSNDLFKNMVLERIGQPVEFKTNPALEYGKNNEANALECFKMELGLEVEDVGFFPFDDWLGASPDGLASDGGVLEIKCPFGLRDDTNPQFKTSQEQPQYYAQMQIEMLCTNKTHCHFYQWNAYAQKHEVVNFDPQWIDENLPLLHKFWLDVQNAEEWKYTHGGEQAKEYEIAKLAYEEATERLNNAKAALIDLVGEDGGHIGNYNITKVTRKGSVNYSKIIKENLPDFDVEPYRGKVSTSWRIS